MANARFSSFDQFFEFECVAENITDAQWLESLRRMTTQRIAAYIVRYGRLSDRTLRFLREVVADRMLRGEADAQTVLAEIDRQLADR
uniref:Uncharacterized protein n=1 Tax=Schlesneria paludicola TaxID=360056 RepID=A0A7C2JZ09_9PLAN